MKKLFLTSSLCFVLVTLFAQTPAEWLKQKETQREYLLKQIAGLQMYLGYVNDGYRLAQKGTSLISKNKGEDVEIHDRFFRSLASINPTINRKNRVGEIIEFQRGILTIYKGVQLSMTSNKAFSTKEIRYVLKVYGNLLSGCATSIDNLLTLTSDKLLDLTDAERIDRIERIYQNMVDKYSFAQSFGNQTIMLALQKVQERKNITSVQSLYGLKK